MGARFGRGWVFGATVTAATAAILMLAGAAAATTSTQVILSSGPLENIWIGTDLSCQVQHTGDTAYELYFQADAPGDCGTFIATGGTLYAPDFANHTTTAARRPLGTYTPFTAISQSAVLGSGTGGDPYRIVTVADVGTTGLRITQTDSYVVGQEAYRTDVQIANSGAQAQSVILYRAGDCYLQGSDQGFGAVGNPSGAVACVAETGPRIEQWVPLTAGSHYLEAFSASVWSAIGGKADFPDTCACATDQDNGAGLSWSLSVPAGSSRTLSNLTNFSPAGNLPLTTTKTADQSGVSAGAQDGYTITLANPNAAGVQVASISDTLPAGFTYVSGSTTGATTSDPTVSGQTLTWTGPFADAATSSISLHFDVTASSTAGTYFNNATADAGSFSVVPTGDTAPVTVTAVTTYTLTVSNTGAGSGSVASSPSGISCGATCSATFASGKLVTLTATPSAGSTFGGWSGGGCSGTGTCAVTLNADTSVTATFAPVTHSLAVSKAGTGTGSVTSSPSGIDCGGTCSASYDEGSTVTLTASADAGSAFSGWTGGGCTGTGTCSVTLDSDTTVTATFTLRTVSHTLTVSKAGTGSGTVSSSPAGIDCGGACSTAYASGATVTLTATPAAGSTFGGWSGGGCSGTGTCIVSLGADTTVTATFTSQDPAKAAGVGYWKNHDEATTALLPITLGNYTVGNLAAASAVFDANNCGSSKGDGVGCLAAELLAAKLNVKNGSDPCIASTISAADALLVGVGYTGPASYALTDTQRSQAIALKNTLQHYDGSGSC
jgi:uncharacterized repeat protein (TIGR01451 family)